ncbi:benenodin family lasso peptide [Rhodanobacter ginsengisoli]|uniref:Benenodin family lasso peptide n=1 Tax=Rhodanobacter ginsengisoli TaxID=418646 RepID=A0ABW0QR67_9GAMM
MNTNKDIRNDTSEDVTELGVASMATKGNAGIGEGGGLGGPVTPGISEE